MDFFYVVLLVSFCVLLFLFIVYKLLRIYYFSGTSCPLKYLERGKGKVALIIGGTTGIGLANAKEFVKLQARKVIIVGHSEKNGKRAKRLLSEMAKKRAKTEIEFMRLDLSSLDEVEEFADLISSEKNIDVIILNSASFTSSGRRLSVDGVEMMFSVAYLGQFHLLECLLPNILKWNVRIMTTLGEIGMLPKEIPKVDQVFTKMEDVSVIKAMMLPKICQLTYMKALDRLLKEESSESSAYTLYPGTSLHISNMLGGDAPWYFRILHYCILSPLSKYIIGKSEKQISQTHLYISFSPKKELEGGGHYEECRLCKIPDYLKDEEVIKNMRDYSFEIVNRAKAKKE